MHISDHVLRCFLALVDEGQFTVAAEQCHLTQSALSQMISRLEERVGVLLFDRDSRSVTVTSEGRRLAETARRITSDLDRAIADLRDIATLQNGPCVACRSALTRRDVATQGACGNITRGILGFGFNCTIFPRCSVWPWCVKVWLTSP